MRARLSLIVLLVAIAYPTADAQVATGTTTERAAFEKELAELKKDPAEYSKMRATFAVSFHFLLSRLGYLGGPIDSAETPELIAALKKYQADRGLPVTGDLMSFDTVNKVKEDTEALDREPLLLPWKLMAFESWENGWITATGTWTLVGDSVAFPEQVSQFRCDKSTMRCIEANASVNRSGSGFGMLSADITEYDIATWDDKEIVTKPNDAVCARYVLRINRLTKSVTGFRTKISNEGICEGLSDTLNSILVDGSEVSTRLRSKRDALFRQLMQFTPAARRLLYGEKR